MRTLYLGLNIFILCFNNIYSQCRPAFTELPSQPPAPYENFNYSTSNSNIDYTSRFFNIQQLRSYKNNQDSQYLTCLYYNGQDWVKLKEVFLKGWVYETINWGDRILLHGNFRTQVDQIKLDKRYSLIEYVNGHWDTLPGSYDNSPYYRLYGVIGNNLYSAYVKEGNGSQDWTIHKYDTINKQFVPLAEISQKYTFPVFRSGKNRMLISGITNLNGQTITGYAYIQDDSIHINNNPILDDSMFYLIDPVTDHIYALKNTYEYTILEFDRNDSFISKRVAIDLKSRSSSPYYSARGIFDGKLVLDDWDLLGNRYISILCPNEVRWKSIRTPSVRQQYESWGLAMVHGNGVFVYDHDSRHVLKLEEGARINGKLYVDVDSNCQYDSLIDLVIKGQKIKALSDKYLTMETSDQNGNYELIVPAGEFNLEGPTKNFNCNSKLTLNAGEDTIKDIALKALNYSDIKVLGINSSRVRWNSVVSYSFSIDNLGRPIDSAYFKIKLDPRVQIYSVDSNMTSYSSNTAYGRIGHLGYFDKLEINFEVVMDTNKLRPNNYFQYEFSAYPFIQDVDSSNNLFKDSQLAVYSFDPNYKSCDKLTIEPNKSSQLIYTVEFQNEGQDDAYDVVVTDRLDNLLDIETFEILSSKHSISSVSINDHLLTITFKDIHLKPLSVNEDSSKGYFQYSISTFSNISKGQVIKNSASIYFDLNPAVVTNTTNTNVEDNSSGLKTFKKGAGNLYVYPNPTNKYIHIYSTSNTSYAIYNCLGVLIDTGSISEGESLIDVSKYAPGIYYIYSGGVWCKIVKFE